VSCGSVFLFPSQGQASFRATGAQGRLGTLDQAPVSSREAKGDAEGETGKAAR
jgi:hypothetical protein